MPYGNLNVDVVQSSTAGTPVQFNDGNGTQVGTLCRAWVNFNGTTSPGTIRAQFNVSSVTKNGTGDYTVNFTNALSDANYAYEFSGGGAVSSGTMVYQGITQTTTSIRYVLAYPGTAQDATTQCVAVFR